MKEDKPLIDGCYVYLSGPIDDAKDKGINWRRHFSLLSKQNNLNLVLLDPTNKPEGLPSEIDEEQSYISTLREEGKWSELRKFMKKIVRYDLRMVDISDFVVAYIDKNIHMCGTYNEAIIADIEKKPILLIIEGGKKMCPSWLFGIVHYDYMFDNVEECVAYLCKVNNRSVIIDDKWVLMRYGIKKIEQLTKETKDAEHCTRI